jgi:hypothetical protein
MITRIFQFVEASLEPLVQFVIPYWHDFMVSVHRVLDPVCERTADTDLQYGLAPCTSAKFVTVVVAHLTLFLYLWSRTDTRTPRLVPQHSVLVFPEDEALPTTDKKIKGGAVSSAGLAGAPGLRLRK